MEVAQERGVRAGAGSAIGRLQKAALARSDDTPHSQEQGPVDGLTEAQLTKLGAEVVEDWKRDQGENADWRRKAEEALDAAAQEPVADKTYPWDKASNVRYPLLTISAMAFASRAYPGIVKGDEAVQVKTFGQDADGLKQKRADRMKAYLNFLLFYKLEGWEADTDALLHILPCVGQHFRKVYYDPIEKRPCVESVSALRLTKSIHAATIKASPRVTHDYDVFPYQLAEKVKAGVWGDTDLVFNEDDSQKPRVILEQHLLRDFDDDGLDEPYIVTVDLLEAKVLRIDNAFGEADIDRDNRGEPTRIKRWMPFSDYSFIPDPKGRSYSIGFGHLLAPIMETINSTINMMMDAGHAQVAGGGFVGSEVRLQGAGKNGVLRFKPSEYKTINASGADIRQAIVERTLPEVSPVLFQLLKLLQDAAEKIASVNDAITGDSARTAPVGTTLALIEQGQQVWNAIWKRVYRALRDEYRLLQECVARWGDPQEYADFCDVQGLSPGMGHNGGPPLDAAPVAPGQPPQGPAPAPGVAQPAPEQDPGPAVAAEQPMTAEELFKADFNAADLDIRPISDPSAATKMQQMAKMQFALQFVGKGVYADDNAVIRTALLDAGVDQAEQWIPEGPRPQPQPNPVQLQMMALEAALKEAQAAKTHAQAQESLAKAAKIIHEATGPAADTAMHLSAARATKDLADAAAIAATLVGGQANALPQPGARTVAEDTLPA